MAFERAQGVAAAPERQQIVSKCLVSSLVNPVTFDKKNIRQAINMKGIQKLLADQAVEDDQPPFNSPPLENGSTSHLSRCGMQMRMVVEWTGIVAKSDSRLT